MNRRKRSKGKKTVERKTGKERKKRRGEKMRNRQE